MDVLHTDVLLMIFAILGPGFQQLLASVCTKWQTAISLTPTPTLTIFDVAEMMRYYSDLEEYLPALVVNEHVRYLNQIRTELFTPGYINGYLQLTQESALKIARIIAIFLFNGDLKKVRTSYSGTEIWWRNSWDPPPAKSEAVEGSADHPDAAVLTTSPSPTPQ
jgi:hypothetical protein